MENNITEKEFWDDFWVNIQLPSNVDLNFSNDKIIAEFINTTVPLGGKEKRALEIGCAPGKWMVFLNKYLNYHTDGCEYLESAVAITQKNLEINEINNANIYVGDFLSYDFGEKKYDLIISLGFIEHFSDPQYVIEKMYRILKTEGVLVIGIPKFTQLNYFIAREVDKTLKIKLLPAHNLKIMNLKFFKKLSKKNQLKPIKIIYSGGFEPAMYNISKTPHLFKLIFRLITWIFHSSIAQTLSRGFYSSYILAAYKKV